MTLEQEQRLHDSGYDVYRFGSERISDKEVLEYLKPHIDRIDIIGDVYFLMFHEHVKLIEGHEGVIADEDFSELLVKAVEALKRGA